MRGSEPEGFGGEFREASTDHGGFRTVILTTGSENETAPFDRGQVLTQPVGCAPMNTPTAPARASFSGYQKLVVGMLAFLQFAVILDFMLMSPLGALIMPSLSVSRRSSAPSSRRTRSPRASRAC